MIQTLINGSWSPSSQHVMFTCFTSKQVFFCSLIFAGNFWLIFHLQICGACFMYRGYFILIIFWKPFSKEENLRKNNKWLLHTLCLSSLVIPGELLVDRIVQLVSMALMVAGFKSFSIPIPNRESSLWDLGSPRIFEIKKSMFFFSFQAFSI